MGDEDFEGYHCSMCGNLLPDWPDSDYCPECKDHTGVEEEDDEVEFRPETAEDKWLIERLGDGQPDELTENQDFAKDDDLNNISAEDIL